VINLRAEKVGHFIRITIILEVGQKEWAEDVQKSLPALTDMLILTIGDKTLEDLKRPDSRESLKKELLMKANQSLNSRKISQIYFDEFLVQ